MLLVVAGIWGAIGYQVYSRYFSKEETVVQQFVPMADYELAVAQSDSLSLDLDYRDPFNSKRIRVPVQQSQSTTTVRKQPKPKETPKPPRAIRWPEVSYLGVMRNDNSDRELALLSIAGKSHMGGRNEVFQGVRVVQVYADSVRVAFSGEEKTVVR